MTEATSILAGLNPLIDQAEREGKWLYVSNRDMWFTPSELREANGQGRFIWGADNWELRDPAGYLAGFRQRLDNAQHNYERACAKVKGEPQ